jgi:DNA-binding transcriptional ArsR family regulator
MQGLTALADPTRKRIVEMLATGAMSAISQHLKTLRGAKLVRVRTQGQKRIYELDPDGIGALADWITQIRSLRAS